MKSLKVILSVLLFCVVLVGCSDKTPPQHNEDMGNSSGSATISPQEQEEQQRINNMAHLNIDFKEMIEGLSANELFELISSDEGYATFATDIKGMQIMVNGGENAKVVSSIFFDIDPVILENNVQVQIESNMKAIFKELGFTYTESIMEEFMDNYVEAIAKTEETGVVTTLILHENENEGFGVTSDCLPQICSIQIRPYDLI